MEAIAEKLFDKLLLVLDDKVPHLISIIVAIVTNLFICHSPQQEREMKN